MIVSQGIEGGFCCAFFIFIFSGFFKIKVFILLIQSTVVYPEDDTMCRHSQTHTMAVFWKIQCTSNLVPVLVEYTCGQLCRHIEWSPVLIQHQHAGILLAAARPLCNWCYHPALFFLHLCLIALSFLQGKILCVSKTLFQFFFYFV